MNLAFRSNNRSNSRRRQQISAPAEIETFESRLLLTTTPGILSPSGTIALDAVVDDAPPTIEFSWEAVDNADSYDLWVSSLGSFEQILLKEDIVGTTIDIPVTDLAEGGHRVWARANLTGGGVSSWSSGRDFTLNVRPVVTGPAADSARHLTADTTPTIEWASNNEAQRFQIWLTDVTSGNVTQYDVDNLTPLLDADGNEVLDFAGQTIPQEIRSFEIPDADALQIGRYRAWVRTVDIDGNRSQWSDFYQFDVGPPPQNLSPAAPSFASAPLLQWDAVDRATNYEVFVTNDAAAADAAPLYRETVDTNSFQIPDTLESGNYTFWVRAILQGTDIPTVYGVWSTPSRFGTLVPPTVLGPVGAEGFVTDRRPTVDWTPIHGAATYEVLVHKRNSRPPFLQTLNNSTSLTFANNLAPGTYTVWVRAIDTRGNASDWSDPLFFEATGGRTVITAPVEGQVVDFPTFTWVAVAEAASYEIWISQTSGGSTVINVAGLGGTSFTPIDPTIPSSQPLPDGDYRVWVRTLFTDGTLGPWSTPVDFVGGVVVENDAESDVEIQLTSLPAALSAHADDVQTQPRPGDAIPADVQDESQDYAVAEPTNEGTDLENGAEIQISPDAALPSDILTELATNCDDAEWWADDNASA